MATIEIGGDAFDVEILSGQTTPSTFSLHVEYRSGVQTGTAVVDLDVDERSDLTVGTIETTLQEWADANDGKQVTSFEFVEETPARRGERVDPLPEPGADAAREEDATTDDPYSGDRRPPLGTTTIRSVPGADPVEGTEGYERGDHVVYRVGDTDSGVYSHTTDGIVAAVPPYRRGQNDDVVREYFLLDVGERRLKQVPTDRIVGHVSDDDVTIDNPRPLDAQH